MIYRCLLDYVFLLDYMFLLDYVFLLTGVIIHYFFVYASSLLILLYTSLSPSSPALFYPLTPGPSPTRGEGRKAVCAYFRERGEKRSAPIRGRGEKSGLRLFEGEGRKAVCAYLRERGEKGSAPI